MKTANRIHPVRRPRMDKPALILRFAQLLEERLARVEANLAEARDGMRVDGCFRPENRGERAAVTSQGYLADGLGRRAGEIREALELLEHVDRGPREVVTPGTLVCLADPDGPQRHFLLLPGGQGDRLETPEGPVTVISPTSPLARTLRGLAEGDEVRIALDGRTTAVEILSLR